MQQRGQRCHRIAGRLVVEAQHPIDGGTSILARLESPLAQTLRDGLKGTPTRPFTPPSDAIVG